MAWVSQDFFLLKENMYVNKHLLLQPSYMYMMVKTSTLMKFVTVFLSAFRTQLSFKYICLYLQIITLLVHFFSLFFTLIKFWIFYCTISFSVNFKHYKDWFYFLRTAITDMYVILKLWPIRIVFMWNVRWTVFVFHSYM